GLAWNGDGLPAENIGRSIPAGSFEDDFPSGARVPNLLHFEADFFQQRPLRPFACFHETVGLEMGSRFNIQSPSVFFRVVLQVKRKPDHPISFFPVSLAAALLFPRGRILVPAPKTVEDGI